MSSILSALQSLAHSLLSLIADAFNSVYSVLQTLFATVAAFVGGLVGLTADTAGFFISNFVVLAVLAGAVFGYVKWQERSNGQGSLRSSKVGGGKKIL
ncbi:uncharacterized protein J3D65DRAFT_643124 [Phyllosticta citribraziliensis]|uniref:Holin n=1 Tax=Phyllosticta citribraziliensis TaxID=989973 RepID=A0ABR1L3Z0_9PEZI